MKKSKDEILNSSSDELNLEERLIKHELLKDSTLTIKEAKKKSEDFFKKLDRNIRLLNDEPEFPTLKYRIKKYISTFFFTLLFSIWVGLIISFGNAVFNNDEVIYTLVVWIYFGTLIILIFLILNKWNSEANLTRLGGHYIGFLILLSIILWITNINININENKVILLDDRTYVENDDYDGSPYSGSAGGYSWENKYFLNIDLLKDGEFFNDTIQLVNHGKDATLKINAEDEIYLNVDYALFWQYAYTKGYKQIGNEYITEGFMNIVFSILPIYFLEIIINPLPKGFLFSLFILVLTIFYGYDITVKD